MKAARLVCSGLLCLLMTAWSLSGIAQTAASERTFAQSKPALEQLLKKLQPSMSGRLPALEGFVDASGQQLDRYRRAYYQTSTQVVSSKDGSSVVRVSTKITAWYQDPSGTHSGYRLLNSNGRLESDLLDQLADELASNTNTAPPPVTAPNADDSQSRIPAAAAAEPAQTAEQPVTSAQPPPDQKATPAVGPFSSPLGPSLPSRERVASDSKASDRDIQAQIQNLEQVLHSQAHPDNLVAVKQAGTPVVATPSLTAKTLFLASAHDEFEMLDFNADWVHVRISGLSRGWIWRNSLEMPDGIPETTTRAGTGPKATAQQLFHVTREETAPFPGDWEPLKGKNVKILSIEKVDDSAKDSGLIMRLEFAKAQLDRNYEELAKKTNSLAGIVLIFDSADGGMIAAPLSAIQQWKAGNLSDSAFWHQCFFDPPELGGNSAASGNF